MKFSFFAVAFLRLPLRLWAGSPSQVLCNKLFAILGSQKKLVSIDLASGTAVIVSKKWNKGGAVLRAIEWHLPSRTAYGLMEEKASIKLATIDNADGAGGPPQPRPVKVIGELKGPGDDDEAKNRARGLAFDADDETLYTIGSGDDGGTIYTVDTETGQATKLVTFTELLGVTVTDLAINPTTNNLYITNGIFDAITFPTIWKSNIKAAGIKRDPVLVGFVEGLGTGADGNRIALGGIAFLPDGTLYGISQEKHPTIYELDISGNPVIATAVFAAATVGSAPLGATFKCQDEDANDGLTLFPTFPTPFPTTPSPTIPPPAPKETAAPVVPNETPAPVAGSINPPTRRPTDR